MRDLKGPLEIFKNLGVSEEWLRASGIMELVFR